MARNVLTRMGAVGAALLLGLAAAGCTTSAEPEPADSPTRDIAPAPSPSASAGGTDSEEARLPIPVDEIPEWAATAVPNADAPGYVLGYSGWMGENTSDHIGNHDTTVPRGTYTVTAACRGEGTIEFSAETEDGASLASGTLDCAASQSQALTVDLPVQGLVADAKLDGGPIVYAFAVQRAS